MGGAAQRGSHEQFLHTDLEHTEMKTLKNAIARIHNDERGMETLQTVMLIAVAAIVLLFVKMYWEEDQGLVQRLVDQILDWSE